MLRYSIYYKFLNCKKKNKYTDICFKYLDYHILLVPFLKLFYRKVRISGIFFRPVLHYSKLNYPYSGIPRSYWYFMLIKNFVLFLFLKTGIMTSCFFQDEGAIEIFGGRKKNAFWIPTPLSSDFIMPPSKNSGQIKKFLFFGQISKRKGIYRVLEAWKKLPSIYQDKTYLNIIGRTSSEDVDRVSELIADLKKNGWLINFDNRFVENEEIPKIYEETDIVLSPHDLQFGTSGVTVQSAVWLRPTIVHELGWVGFTVKNKSLGLSIDSANIELFAKIIIEIIDGVIKLNVQEKIAYDLRKINSSNLWAENLYYGIIRGNG